ncbi:SurA N-terminal domain-containing protein [Bordetella holmesii]|uniref:Periplasmic chaperone PpiD n=2 Tax=Bordetella holmesii TaxID=35814 RepID=A0A158M8T5_9BORD|nr:SurA N-terminal domain-containing protein [Bordetella holmesii]AHV91599.1 surA N-terminal domain protein [Bordetella holmesii ATCC 51541]EWM41094.1 surA N-terminal domain protein [Bordetella holmesii 35009]EWM41763.1 surA N-terminal domain protein [Bordetella holmesii 41130]EWM44983.1 surA N-terminal domain protein [Bordetella holmesii 70147]AMD46978.1 peptidylprolyl isomerase [Bordetella holmesii H558]
MFEFIRTHRRWMQLILLLLIVPSFALVGVQGYTSFVNGEPELATVAGQGVKQSEFDAAHRNQLEQFRQRLGTQFDPAVLDTPAMREQLLNQLIDQRLLAQVALDNRFSVSDETLRNTIAAIPQVQDDGRFSPERYRQVLAAQGLSPTSFENGLRRDLAVARVLEPIGLSARVPQVVVQDVEQALTQKRTIQLRTFAAADFRSKVTVTPQDVQTWYEANKESLRVPEQVQAQYLVLDEAAATQGVEVKDEDIASYYEQNKNRFGTPEQRRASHILINSAASDSADARKAARAKAEEIARQAAANPAGFADLAKKDSQDAGSAAQGGDLGWIAANSVPPSLQQAIAGMSKDAVSGVIESPFGFHILKVTEVKPAQVKTLAEVKDQISGEIRKQLASARFAEMATKLQGAVYDQRDSLQPAADALGLKLRTATGITRSGLLPATQAGAGSAAASADSALLENPRVRQALFAADVLREKQNTGVIELAPDTLLALRVAVVEPSQIPPLDKVKDGIRARLLDERSAQAAREAGEQALKALQTQDQAEGFGAPLTISRQDPGNLPRTLVDAVMRMDAAKLPGFAGVPSGSDYVLARLDKVEAGQPDAQAAEMLARQLGGAWGEAEDQAVLKMLREAYKVQILPPAAPIIKGDQPAEG